MTRHRVALLLIILSAFFVRVWQLPYLPPGLWYDEAYNALDAIWMLETGRYQPFVVGNNGREALLHWLLSLSIWGLGNSMFAARLVGSLAGVLTIPVVYRFALALSKPLVDSRSRRWFALAAAGWVAVSWWHLLNSRVGFRPVLLPLLLMVSLYFFWRGWEGVREAGERRSRGAKEQRSGGLKEHLETRNLNFALAGLFLGLLQYTYLPARLAPLIFGSLALLLTLSTLRTTHYAPRWALIKKLWLGLMVTAVMALLIFLPLGLFYFNNPQAFSSRTEDVVFVPDTPREIAVHALQSLSFFLGAGHELYRHHLPGRAMLGWLEIPFFWLGLIWLLRPARLRRAETQLILLGLAIMWLPALLASPPVHSLRPIGQLPFYYFIVTVGLYQFTLFTQHAIRNTRFIFPFALTFFISLNGLINTVDYFWRWANHPEVYKEFNGPLVDLTRDLMTLTRSQDVIIPFHVYAHPVTRFLLWNNFAEVTGQPAMQRPTTMLIVPDKFQLLYVGNIPYSPALALLTRNQAGQGQIYVSRPPRSHEQESLDKLLAATRPQLTPWQDKLGREIAYFAPVTNHHLPLTALFNSTPLRAIHLNWANLVELTGYDVTPQLAMPGRPITLNFYWRSLTDFTFDDNLFLQLVDGAGNPVNQLEEDGFREDMYRWRPNGILPTQHTLWLGPDSPPGPYLVRVGFFDPNTGQRLPLQAGECANSACPNSEFEADQTHLGLFYVTKDGTDPRIPAAPLSATFGNAIQLLGVTLPAITNNQLLISNLPVTFHWQALRPTDRPYTVFLQLLNQQGDVVGGWDSQPFGGLYPTNYWSPGEVIADTFELPLPQGGLSPGHYRLITGFYDFETGQRLIVEGGGDFAELAEFEVE